MPLFILGIARADSVFGEYERVGEHQGMITVEGKKVSLEDPYVWHKDETYHMLVKNFHSDFDTPERGAIYLYSPDGIHWQVPAEGAGTYTLDVTWKEGITTRQRRMERPQLLIENGIPKFLYLSTIFNEEGKKHINNHVGIYNVVFEVK